MATEKTKYFRVKIGFKPMDFLSIPEAELETAIRAQITGKVALLSGGSVSGNSILAITPDYQRLMGWQDDYTLTGEDMREIGRVVRNEYELAIEGAKREVVAQLEGPGALKRLGN